MMKRGVPYSFKATHPLSCWCRRPDHTDRAHYARDNYRNNFRFYRGN